MPILGTIASSYLATPAGTFESIASIKLTSTSTSITFSSIPSTYAHLMIRCSQTEGLYNIQLNGDTSANYSRAYGAADGVSIGVAASTGNDSIAVMEQGNAGIQGINIIDILDYTSTTKIKSYYAFCGKASSGGGELLLGSGVWNSTAAITSVTFTGGTAGTGSVFSLYGIKSA